MRQSIGGAWLFSISITLMMFIIAYVAISIDYSNAFQLKDDVLLYIEQYNGLNENSAKLILNRMKSKKYMTKIDCNKDYDTSSLHTSARGDGKPSSHYWGLVNYNTTNTSVAFKRDPNTNAYICIYRYLKVQGDKESSDYMNKVYYSVTTSFGFIFPIVGDLFNYRVNGETNTINYPDDKGFKFD